MPKPASRTVTKKLLADTFLFREWAPEDLQALLPLARMLQFEKGEFVFHQEEECLALYLLLQGEASMLRTQTDGRDVILHVFQRGALLGCSALFLDALFPASARVESARAEVLRVEGKGFLRVLDKRSDLSRRMIATLAGRLANITSRMENQMARSASARLAAWLVDRPLLRPKEGPPTLTLSATKKSLAGELQIAPETLSRLFKRFETVGLIRVEGRDIVLLDTSGLMDLSEETVDS